MQKQLPPQIKRVWRMRAVIDGAIWLVIAIGLAVANHFWHWPLWLAGIAVGAAVVHAGCHFVLIPYRYNFWRYQITATAVYLRSGFIFRKSTAIPITRIQNVTLEAGPLLQWQHLQAVQVQTASDKHEIAGVTLDVAAELRDKIMQLAKEARDDA
ncbi:PH domain-containing protein [Lacticaseibacillus sp. GG6-2]